MALGAACASSPSVPLHSSAGGPRDVVWADAAHTEALFLPESMLRGTDWSHVPLTENERGFLADYFLKKYPEPPGPPPLFNRPNPDLMVDRDSGLGPATPSAQAFRDFAATRGVVAVCRVVRVVRGWYTDGIRATSMVWVRPLEVLKAEDGWPRVGELIVYDQRHAVSVVAGRSSRWVRPDNVAEYEAAPNDKILLLGGGRYYDGPFLIGGRAWQLAADGRILPGQYTFVQAPAQETVASLRRFLAAGSPR